ncbi:hypothetical protein ACLOJK_015092 [Asimina triloba]
MPADGWLLTLGHGFLAGCFWMISEASLPFEGAAAVINGWLLKNSIAFMGFCSIVIALLHLPWPTGQLERFGHLPVIGVIVCGSVTPSDRSRTRFGFPTHWKLLDEEMKPDQAISGWGED